MILSAPIGGGDERQARRFRWMVLASVAFHGLVLSLGSSVLVAPVPAARDPVVTVDLTELPPPDPPAPPAVREAVPAPGLAAGSASGAPVPRHRAIPASARRWLEKLDDPLAEKPRAAPRERAAPLPAARRVSGDHETRPDDIADAAARLRARVAGERLDALETRVRARRTPAVLGGDGIDGGPVVNGVTDGTGDPVPAGIRDMIRNRVAGYLPELEAAYSAAFRSNPNLMGKLVIRMRIDARGRVARAEPVGAAALDASFAAAVLEKVRGWVFLPPAGIAVEVIYPFVFVAPS
ncbi:MAG: AgmX/PglI C-terminal domain-containing protein [Gemmatimonadota bacterium]